MAGKWIGMAAIAAALVAASVALAAPSNGGFETGNFDGWERTHPGEGKWKVYAGDEAPYPPPAGDFAAEVEQGGPGLNILHRKMTAKRGRFLSFYVAYENTAGDFATPKSFKFKRKKDNQQLRVDLLKKDAPIKSLERSDILATLLRTREGDPLSSPYELEVVDLEAEGIKGKFQFRVAEVDNVSNFFVGFDELFQSDLVP